jgi:hypothetical protein
VSRWLLEPQPEAVASKVAKQKIQPEPQVNVDEKWLFVTQSSFLVVTGCAGTYRIGTLPRFAFCEKPSFGGVARLA